MNMKDKNVYRCWECPAYSPGCCTVDNMPAEDENTCKFAGIFKNLEEGDEYEG